MNMSWQNTTDFFGNRPSFHDSMNTAVQEYSNLEQTVHFQAHEIMSLRATIEDLVKKNQTLNKRLGQRCAEVCELRDNGRKYRSTKSRLGQRCSQVSQLQEENQTLKKVLANVRETIGQ